MCDYSAEGVKNRKARAGDQLQLVQIGQHTKGFASPTDRATAVCLCQGTTLVLTGIPKALRRAFGVGAQAMATFSQRTQAEASRDDGVNPLYYRDGLVFDGKTQFVSLQCLTHGIEATVESIPNETARTAADAATSRTERQAAELATT
ncbi:hypothetical protein KGO04_02770 [Patescibacteria group bacterium]|nr:hypothetical protein [Patescibacteria group bacterium]